MANYVSLKSAFRHWTIAASIAAVPALAQTSTNVNFLLSFNSSGGPAVHHFAMLHGSIGTLGNANLSLDGVQTVDDSGKPSGNFQGTLSIVFNRLDRFDLTLKGVPLNTAGTTLSANVTAGTGAYKGATGAVSLTLSSAPGSSSLSLSGSGSVTIGSKTTSFTLGNLSGPYTTVDEDRMIANGGGNLPPLGAVSSATVTGEIDDASDRHSGTLTVNLNSTDSVNFFLNFTSKNASSVPAVVAGGTGAYAGATGNATLTLNPAPNNGFSITGFGTINQRPPTAAVISDVRAAFGSGQIGQNAWIAIKGKNLVPATLPASGVNWDNAPDFASGNMPTILQDLAVNVNGQRGYVQFYCSAATDPACADDQVNILTPLDTTSGYITLFVNNAGTPSAPFVVPMRPVAPSFLDFDILGHVVAVHLDASLLGPASLYPGLSTPAKAGETILAFAIGFGLPSTTVTAGSATQSGPLPQMPVCYIGAAQATVTSAYIISPGLTQITLIVPTGTPSGDNLLFCEYQGSSSYTQFTAAGNILTVQ